MKTPEEVLADMITDQSRIEEKMAELDAMLDTLARKITKLEEEIKNDTTKQHEG